MTSNAALQPSYAAPRTKPKYHRAICSPENNIRPPSIVQQLCYKFRLVLWMPSPDEFSLILSLRVESGTVQMTQSAKLTLHRQESP
mmetsp:Transcript_18774/g.27133  ORF Transcript_18774/g.27133 Transcript_18774/m.27133 type:complete len:86 (-) Transcript_18774:698-955(-)